MVAGRKKTQRYNLWLDSLKVACSNHVKVNSPALEFVYFFHKIKERAWKLDRDFFVSSKTTSIQGKIDIFETQKNEYWKERKPDILTVLLDS